MTQLMEMTNPYKSGSKLAKVFDALRPGFSLSLRGITDIVYSTGKRETISTTVFKLQKRRTASALRTIRTLPDVSLTYNRTRKTYLIFQAPLGA